MLDVDPPSPQPICGCIILFKDRGQSLASTVHDRHFRELNAGLEVYFRAGRIMFVE